MNAVRLGFVAIAPEPEVAAIKALSADTNPPRLHLLKPDYRQLVTPPHAVALRVWRGCDVTMHPPYPPDTRAKGYRFELDYERILQSDTWALASMRQRHALLMFWFVAWQQTPCGSMPDSDELIAARIGMETGEFEQNRAILLRGWEKADDGRLYHPVVSEMVLEMLARKTRETQRKADYRARIKDQNVPPLSQGTDSGQTRDSTGSDDTGTGTSKHKPPCSPSASESADDGFAEFWEQYPKKVAKPAAEKAWRKIKPSNRLLADLMAGLARQKASADWQKDGGQFIPHPASWLNARRWEDEQTLAPNQAGAGSGGSIFDGAL